MKINKAIFGVDDSYFLEFWPIQAKICKKLLGIEPVLFYICDEDSDFYHDGNGMVKKIKKVRNNQNGNIVHSGLLACIVRMYGTKYFPDEVCLTCDLDMLMINKDYFVNQIEKYDDNSLVIYSSDAYDLNRPESVELFNNEPFPFTQEMYNYPYNAAKGKVFNQILNTDCTFEEFVNRHANYKPGYNFMWMIDEFYFADCVNNKNHNVEVHKLKRGYTSPWIADRRIDRGNFPVQLEWEGEIEFQNKYGVYDEQKLRDGYYIDANCCRPYSKYKDEIDKLVNIVLKNDFIEVIEIDETTELCEIMERHGSDKSCKPTWVDYEGHNYTRFYSQLFDDIRTDNINFFELGLGTNNTDIPCNMGRLGTPGASLKGWKEYFPNANIYGADIDKAILFNEGRIKTFYCDQTNSIEVLEMWKTINKKFDIIIDDGLHDFNANLNFLKNSLDKLNDGGYYIIEDVVNGEINFWCKEIENLREEFPAFEFKIVKLKWTHDDNNLIVIKKENNKKIDLQNIFTSIYDHPTGWGSKESKSGVGSELNSTKRLRQELNFLFLKYKINSILDVPCGDFNWFSQMDLSDIKYVGGDIVKNLVEVNKTKFPNFEFFHIDITKDNLIQSDLVVTRDCFVHLSNDNILRAIDNIKNSGSRYLLTTSFTKFCENIDINDGEWREINLMIHPFNLKPIYLINEMCFESYPLATDKCMLLFDLKDLYNCKHENR